MTEIKISDETKAKINCAVLTEKQISERKQKMEKFTAKEYVKAFISNQNNKDEWILGYPKGLSVRDLVENDTIDIMTNLDEKPETGIEIIDCGTVMLITDSENYETQYTLR
jgi:hypothetical protein